MRSVLSAFAAVSFLAAGFILPVSAQTAGLTEAQIQAVINLVGSFGADAAIVKNVEVSLRGQAASSVDTAIATTTDDSKNRLKLEARLERGSNGEEVRLLQKILASDPALYPEGLITGFFGSLTESAVKRFQAKLKIDQVGTVGPETLAKINELLSLAGVSGDVPSDFLNSRVKIEIRMKDGKEEIKFEVKKDNSGKDDKKDHDSDDNDDDDDDDDDDEDEDEDEDEGDDDNSGSGSGRNN
jgi:hypothetical protein